MCEIIFEKAKSRGATLNWTSVYAEAAVWRFFVKKVLLEISQNLQENIYAGISFLIKLNSVILHQKLRFICKIT